MKGLKVLIHLTMGKDVICQFLPQLAKITPINKNTLSSPINGKNQIDSYPRKPILELMCKPHTKISHGSQGGNNRQTIPKSNHD